MNTIDVFSIIKGFVKPLPISQQKCLSSRGTKD